MTNIPKLSRRHWMRLGALTISGYELLPFAAPRNVHAQSSVTPRGTARSVIFLNLQGGPSPMDLFDPKQGKWAPENRDVRATSYGYPYSYGLMPKLVDHLGDLALVRSAQAWETVHSRGQYYLQTGHAVSAARIKETLSMGAVIAYESIAHRRPSDFLPPFIAMNYDASTMYGPLLGEGCLPSDCAPLTLDLRSRDFPFVVDPSRRDCFGVEDCSHFTPGFLKLPIRSPFWHPRSIPGRRAFRTDPAADRDSGTDGRGQKLSTSCATACSRRNKRP